MRLLYLCLPLLVLLAACGAHQSSGPRVVARLSGQSVSQPELDAYTRYAATFDSVVYPDSTEAGCATDRRAACARFRSGILARLIEEHVVLGYARRHHITLTPGDLAEARLQLEKLMAPSAPTARLFHLGVTRQFVTHVVQRQLLIQRVEESVVGDRATAGPEFHVTRIGIPNSGSSTEDNRSVIQLATSGKIPAGAAEKTEWMAPFRMAPRVRQALEAAKKGDYVGPFSRPGYVLVIKLLGRGTHHYSRTAHALLTSKLFRSWVSRAVARAHPRCVGAAGTPVTCPSYLMKNA